MQITKEEVIQNLRRQSRGHQQNSSQYRGVTLHQKGKWEARIGTLIGRKYKYVHFIETAHHHHPGAQKLPML